MNVIDLGTIFVPEHIAYLLKSIDFDFKCLLTQSVYNEDKFTCINIEKDNNINTESNEILIEIEDLKLIRNSELPKDNISLDKTHKTFVAIPTYEQVFLWFRNKGYDINIIYVFDKRLECGVGYEYEIIYNYEWLKSSRYFNSYEGARKECLTELIKLYKEKYGNK